MEPASATFSPMRRHTTLDLDLELLHEAADALGTRRTTDTVHAALADVVARRRRSQLVRMDFPDLTPGLLARMRTPRSVVPGEPDDRREDR